MERRPIIIVGSGPAGIATALYLQRLDPGLAADTLVLEKARHPRDKICAGGLIPRSLAMLRDLGLNLDVPHVTVHRAAVTTPRRRVAYAARNLCHVVRRREFDAFLAAACRKRGIEIREEEGVVEVGRSARGVTLETARGRYEARLVVAADGSGSIVRRRLLGPAKGNIGHAIMCDIAAPPRMRDEPLSYEFDFRGVREGIRGYRWAFPCLIDGAPHLNVGVYSVEPAGSRLRRWLAEYVKSFGVAMPRTRAFPIRWYRPGSALSAPRVLLAGDAAGVDALMGEGISLALEYGSFAARAACDAIASGQFSGADYQRAIEASSLGTKLRRLYLLTKLFYGPTWPLWFALAERSRRMRTLGLNWYNGVGGWDHRSAWQALGAVLLDRVDEG